MFSQILPRSGSMDPADSPYHYVPTQWITVLFVFLFSVTTFLHTGQSIYYRVWWLIPSLVFAGFLEILGWAARVWSSISPSLMTPFQIQITCTIIAPTPIAASNFLILERIIQRLGPAYSRLSPRLYAIIFLSCDFVSLIVQGIGGGMAAIAVGRIAEGGDPDLGGNVMLGGIIFQMITISLYVICGSEFLIRYLWDAPVASRVAKSSLGKVQEQRGELDGKLKLMIAALGFDTLCLFIRAVYRTIELIDGWEGRIISTQLYFNVLDGAMIVLAMYTFNFAHPGRLLPPMVRNPLTPYDIAYRYKEVPVFEMRNYEERKRTSQV